MMMMNMYGVVNIAIEHLQVLLELAFMKNLVKKRIPTKAPVLGVEEKAIILQLVTLQNTLKDII
jgi:hypothetical protein